MKTNILAFALFAALASLGMAQTNTIGLSSNPIAVTYGTNVLTNSASFDVVKNSLIGSSNWGTISSLADAVVALGATNALAAPRSYVRSAEYAKADALYNLGGLPVFVSWSAANASNWVVQDVSMAYAGHLRNGDLVQTFYTSANNAAPDTASKTYLLVPYISALSLVHSNTTANIITLANSATNLPAWYRLSDRDASKLFTSFSAAQASTTDALAVYNFLLRAITVTTNNASLVGQIIDQKNKLSK